MVEQERFKLRPHTHLFAQGTIAVVAFMTPVFVVLYVLTLPSGPWRAVLVTQVLASLFITAAAIAYFRVGIWVDRSGITEVGFFGKITRVAVADIGSVFVARVFDASGADTVPQLFVRDREGRQLIRMRGEFWSQASMDRVLATLEVPRERRDGIISTRELRDEYPGLLYWFERRPVLAALAFTLGTGVVGLIVWLLFVISGWA